MCWVGPVGPLGVWFFFLFGRFVGMPVVVLLVGGDSAVGLRVVERVVVFRRALVASVCGRVGGVLGWCRCP